MHRARLALLAGIALAASALPGLAEASVCKPAVSAVGHGQNIEPSLPDFGVGHARAEARKLWRAKVKSLYGIAYARLARAHDITYAEEGGAGQIYVTLTARPCRP